MLECIFFLLEEFLHFLSGLGFIETYGWAVDNKDQISPLGFEVIFSSMIKSAEKLDLNLPLNLHLVNLVKCKRDSTIKRYIFLFKFDWKVYFLEKHIFL